MKIFTKAILTLCILLSNISPLCASEKSPWGKAKVLDITYTANKVLYDLTTGDKNTIANILNRVGLLYKLYGSDTFDSSIVIVIHGDAIPFFAISEFKKHEDIIRRAQSLTVGTSIEFRMCRAAAKLLKYDPVDIHGFINMVPMADAEIARLQHEHYAYMQ